MQIKTFSFNPFQVNTYLVFDESKQVLIIDPACYDEDEQTQLLEFITENELILQKIVLTHAHIDHILGVHFLQEKFNAELYIHKLSQGFLANAKSYGEGFGFYNVQVPEPNHFVDENDLITIGALQFKVLYTPGHADGSICLYSQQEQIVFTGDVLFHESIGRSDLPTGNHKLLISNIKTKLLTLDKNTIVYPGHGSSTTIAEEMFCNPFL